MNYNDTPLIVRGEEGAVGVQFFLFEVAVLFLLLVCGFKRALGGLLSSLGLG